MSDLHSFQYELDEAYKRSLEIRREINRLDHELAQLYTPCLLRVLPEIQWTINPSRDMLIPLASNTQKYLIKIMNEVFDELPPDVHIVIDNRYVCRIFVGNEYGLAISLHNLNSEDKLRDALNAVKIELKPEFLLHIYENALEQNKQTLDYCRREFERATENHNKLLRSIQQLEATIK